MRKTLEKLIRNPNFISKYRSIGRTMSVIFGILFLPIFFLLALVSSLFSKSIDQRDKEQGALTEEELEQLILQWLNLHTHKFESVTKKFVKSEDDSHLVIHIIPKNNKSLPMTFRVGGQILFGVILGEHYYLEYDSDNGMGSHSLNKSELNYLLDAYLQGDYYVEEWFIDEKKLGDKIYIRNLEGKYTSSFNSNASNLELKFANIKKINFEPL